MRTPIKYKDYLGIGSEAAIWLFILLSLSFLYHENLLAIFFPVFAIGLIACFTNATSLYFYRNWRCYHTRNRVGYEVNNAHKRYLFYFASTLILSFLLYIQFFDFVLEFFN